MNDLITRMASAIENSESAAAASALLQNIPDGEIWRISEVQAYHDDPAGSDLYWSILGEGAMPVIVMHVGATAINVRTRLSAYYPCPFWLTPDMSFRMSAPAPLAAGKKFYMFWHVSKIRGVPAGTYL